MIKKQNQQHLSRARPTRQTKFGNLNRSDEKRACEVGGLRCFNVTSVINSAQSDALNEVIKMKTDKPCRMMSAKILVCLWELFFNLSYFVSSSGFTILKAETSNESNC